MPTVLLSTFILTNSSSVSLSYFHLAVPMRKCWGEHSCISSLFSIAILNGTPFKINNPEDLRLHGINPKPQIRDGEKEEKELPTSKQPCL